MNKIVLIRLKNIVIIALVALMFLIGIGYAWSYVNQDLQLAKGNSLQSVVSDVDRIPVTNNLTSGYNQTDKEIKLAFVGDIMLSRTIETQIINNKNPFAGVKKAFENGYVIGNLECVVSNSGQKADGKLYTFRANPRVLDTLIDSNFNLVNLANNHTMDYGSEALREMLDNLAKIGLPSVGAGNNLVDSYKYHIAQLGDTKIAFIGLNDIELDYAAATDKTPGSARMDSELAFAAIREAKQKSDIVVVMPHWGQEYNTLPTSRQIQFAQKLTQAGADLIVGSHPHVVQKVSIVNDKPVMYSLGNFVFDGMDGIPGATDSTIFTVRIKNKKVFNYDEQKVKINSQGFPVLA